MIVIVAVFGGYWLENGDLRLLMQPAEFVIIWGAALGSLISRHAAAGYPACFQWNGEGISSGSL